MTAKNTSAKNAAEKLVEDATEAGLVTEETTVPAQGKKDKITVENGTGQDGQPKTVIVVSEDDEEEPTRLQKLLGKVKENKKAIIAGGVAVLAIALGVTVQKKRTTTDEESETEVVESATEA